MRGMGDFQRAQMKHRDARVSAMAQHLRAAVDLWEEIQLYPFKEAPAEAPPQAPPPAPPPVIALPPEKLAYGIKEAAGALRIGRTTIWRAIKDGKLSAVKVGNRTLIDKALQAACRARRAHEITPLEYRKAKPNFARMCNRYASDIRKAGMERDYWGFDEWSETRINRCSATRCWRCFRRAKRRSFGPMDRWQADG